MRWGLEPTIHFTVSLKISVPSPLRSLPVEMKPSFAEHTSNPANRLFFLAPCQMGSRAKIASQARHHVRDENLASCRLRFASKVEEVQFRPNCIRFWRVVLFALGNVSPKQLTIAEDMFARHSMSH